MAAVGGVAVVLVVVALLAQREVARRKAEQAKVAEDACFSLLDKASLVEDLGNAKKACSEAVSLDTSGSLSRRVGERTKSVEAQVRQRQAEENARAEVQAEAQSAAKKAKDAKLKANEKQAKVTELIEKLKAASDPAERQGLEEELKKAQAELMGGAATGPTPAVTATGTAPPPAAGISLVAKLTANPNFPVYPTQNLDLPEWKHSPLKYIFSWSKGDNECPPISTTNFKDEFDKREREPAIRKKCEDFVDDMKHLMAVCPSRQSAIVRVSDYNFDKKAFEIPLGRETFELAEQDWVFMAQWGGQALLKWPGASADRPGACGQLFSGRELFQFWLKMEESEAKKFAAKIRPEGGGETTTFLDVVYVLDGGVMAAKTGCGKYVTKPSPTGRVLAWRLSAGTTVFQSKGVTEWSHVSNFDDSHISECDRAHKVLEPWKRGGR